MPAKTSFRGTASSRRTDRPPALVLVSAGFAVALFALPLVALLWRAPWSSAWDVLTASESRHALWLSIQTSLAATLVAVVLGVPLAWVQARHAYPGRRIVRALTLLPMVLPPVVGGIALLLAFGRRGLAGQYLDDAGVNLPFHIWGAIIAETFVAMPFLVLTVEAAFRSVDRRYEDAARSLGASKLRVFRRVTLPAVRPALIAGAVLRSPVAWLAIGAVFGLVVLAWSLALGLR